MESSTVYNEGIWQVVLVRHTVQKISTAVHDRTCQMETYFFLLFSACIAASASRGAWHSVEYQGNVLAGLYLLVIQLSGQLLMLWES
jgi:hypothetical protein